jgi:hypothetical protein
VSGPSVGGRETEAAAGGQGRGYDPSETIGAAAEDAGPRGGAAGRRAAGRNGRNDRNGRNVIGAMSDRTARQTIGGRCCAIVAGDAMIEAVIWASGRHTGWCR